MPPRLLGAIRAGRRGFTRLGQPRQDDLMAYLLDLLTPERLQELEPLLRIDPAPRPLP